MARSLMVGDGAGTKGESGVQFRPRTVVLHPQPPRPFLSVVLLGFYRKDYIIDALDSVLNQTIDRSNYEILTTKRFVDSGIDAYLAKNNVAVLRAPTELQGDAYRVAINAANGEVIVFIEDDDRFLPRKLEIVKALFSERPDLDFYHNNYSIIDGEGETLAMPGYHGRARMWLTRNRSLRVSGERTLSELRKASKCDVDFNPSCISVRRSVLLPYAQDFACLPASMDVALFFSALLSGRDLLADDQMLTEYRIHTANTSLPNLNNQPEHLRHRNEVALREKITYNEILKWTERSKSQAIVHAARGLLCCHEISLVFLSGTDSRDAMLRALVNGLPYFRSFTWRRRGPIEVMAMGFAVLPSLARSLYFHGLKRGAVFGRDWP